MLQVGFGKMFPLIVLLVGSIDDRLDHMADKITYQSSVNHPFSVTGALRYQNRHS